MIRWTNCTLLNFNRPTFLFITDINVNGWRPSPLPSLQAFQAVVRGEGGWYTTIRTPRGRDEAAACGQLATEVAAEARGKRRASPAGGSGNSGE